MKEKRKEKTTSVAKMIDSLENDRNIQQVLLAISKGQKVTKEERARAIKYEQSKRKSK